MARIVMKFGGTSVASIERIRTVAERVKSQFEQGDDSAHRVWISCQGGQHLVLAVFDALGDLQFTLARQQFHRAHFAHVHAYRIGGSAEFAVDAGQGRGGCFRRVLVGGDRRIGNGLIIDIGRGLEYLDAHVVDHADDVFYLLRFDDAVG